MIATNNYVVQMNISVFLFQLFAVILSSVTIVGLVITVWLVNKKRRRRKATNESEYIMILLMNLLHL